MKLFIILVAVIGLLLVGSTVQAAKTNLIPNGSFEDGFAGWDLLAMESPTLVAGRCGTNAASIENSFVRNNGLVMRRNRTYRLVFWFKGTVQSSVSPEKFQASDWTKVVRDFKGVNVGTHIWFLGYNNQPGFVDCVVVRRVE